MKKIITVLLVLVSSFSFSQLVINELDADTPGTDVLEFIELKSATPNFSLNGYILVFFNGLSTGTGTASYLTIELNGYTTDINGIILLGNPMVSPTPVINIAANTIQNGPDGVAIYQRNAADFPINTLAPTSGLIDGFAYSNAATPQATALMSVFGLTACPYENQSLSTISKSFQRKSDGSFELKAPTPGMNNDGSGVIFNYVTTTTNLTTINEGQDLIITSTTTLPVTDNPLNLNFTLNNGGFNSTDFSGNSSITIPVGATTASTTIHILNDGINDGDEEALMLLDTPPTDYILNNNSIIIRVNDVNFTTLPFGTPLNPTHGMVSSTAPVGYYDSLEGLSGAALKQALQNIIANPSVVHAQNYGDVFDVLKVADQNPENNNQVWLIYTEQPRSKIDMQTGNSIVGKWNREHIYCQSRGGFTDGTSSTADGINVWLPTNADDILAGHGDSHHIRAVDGQENSSRNNRNYGVDYNGPTGNPGTWKGDVARALFYMGVRYNALSVVNGNPADTIVGQIGDLATLLQWNHTDPADDFEMNRNNYIYTWQVNRNPFIDYPSLADYIYGTNYGQPWFSTLSATTFSDLKVFMYPNPAHNYIKISGLTQSAKVAIYNMTGDKVLSINYSDGTEIPLNLASGIYAVSISTENQSVVKKLVIQ